MTLPDNGLGNRIKTRYFEWKTILSAKKKITLFLQGKKKFAITTNVSVIPLMTSMAYASPLPGALTK